VYGVEVVQQRPGFSVAGDRLAASPNLIGVTMHKQRRGLASAEKDVSV
jgi:hypothetical protein